MVIWLRRCAECSLPSISMEPDWLSHPNLRISNEAKLYRVHPGMGIVTLPRVRVPLQPPGSANCGTAPFLHKGTASQLRSSLVLLNGTAASAPQAVILAWPESPYLFCLRARLQPCRRGTILVRALAPEVNLPVVHNSFRSLHAQTSVLRPAARPIPARASRARTPRAWCNARSAFLPPPRRQRSLRGRR